MVTLVRGAAVSEEAAETDGGEGEETGGEAGDHWEYSAGLSLWCVRGVWGMMLDSGMIRLKYHRGEYYSEVSCCCGISTLEAKAVHTGVHHAQSRQCVVYCRLVS